MPTAPTRILLKLSGEAFKGPEGAFSPAALEGIAGEIAPVSFGIAIVVGAGNILRGARSALLDRIEADTLGMLATVLNALALRTYLEACGRDVFVQSAIDTELTNPVSPRDARRALDQGAIVIFAGGTGSPLVTTDTAAALRAIEIDAEVLLMAKNNVDGIYGADPLKHPEAKRFDKLTYLEILNMRLEVMDSTALSLCMENKLPIIVFDLQAPHTIERAVVGEPIGTLVSGE